MKVKQIIVTDDLDGTEGAETVKFSLNGSEYEIDLVAKNRHRLEEALLPFVEAGRKAKRSYKRKATTTA